MRPKIFTLYAAGIALLIVAAGCGDNFNTLPASAWGGSLAAGIALAIGGIVCLAYGRGLEIERESRRRRSRIERPEYRKHRKDA